MTANLCSGGSPLKASLLLAALGGMLAVASAGCSAKPVCERDIDCGEGYLCIDNERCVLNPRSDGGIGGGPDAGQDAGTDSGVDPAACDSETDVFDADQVYLLGSLSGVDCTPAAIASLDAPDLESVGFPCDFDAESAVIRPIDGRLLYVDSATKTVRVFTRDEHPYDSTLGACRYPANPAANDAEVPTPSCDNSGGAVDFRVAPDAEDIWYTCGNTSGLWFDENDMLGFLGGSTPLMRGLGNTVLATQGSAGTATAASLELYASGVEIELGELGQEGDVLAVRGVDDGFQVVVRGDGEGSGQILLIGFDGSVTSGGSYPSLPANVSLDATGAGYALDADGALYVSVYDDQERPAIAKLVPGQAGSASVVYTEADAPDVGTVSATLVTGL